MVISFSRCICGRRYESHRVMYPMYIALIVARIRQVQLVPMIAILEPVEKKKNKEIVDR